MVFKERLGKCTNCGFKLVVCKELCKKCYMNEWNNRKEVRLMKKKWEKDNKWKRKLRQAQRCILIRTKEFIPINLLKEIFKRDNFTCQYCGTKRNLSVDHKIPISKKIDNSKKNLIVSCVTCNALKSNMSVKEFCEKYKQVPIPNQKYS